MRISTLTPVLLLGSLLGCDGGGPGAVGAPCNTAEDCQGDLICDEHNNQGSCQDPHGHSESETSDGTSSETATSTTSELMTSGTTEAPEETTGGEETDGTAETAGTTTGSESGESELCEAYCGCMVATCGELEAYPYADHSACMGACEAFEQPALQCFGGFCQQATLSEGTLVEHYCEHAWGELGDEKC